MLDRLAGPSAVLGLGVLALVGLAAASAAHNPADTIYHPAPVGDELLVVGGEGTWAFLTPDGEVTDEGNLTGEGEVIGPPVSTADTAAALVRTFPDTELVVQGFDEAGPTWRVQVEPGEAEAIGYLAADGEGFAVFTSEARVIEVTPEGEIATERELDAEPTAAPALHPEDGWLVPLPGELVHVADGQTRSLASYDGLPTDVTVSGDRVLLSLAHRSEDVAELRVFEEGSLAFSRTIDAWRFGGSPAAVADRIVVGTYASSGAELIGLEADDGSRAWDRQIAGATAVAPAAVDGTIVAASNDHVLAYEPDGTQRWQKDAQPYLASPVQVGDLVVPSGAGNELVAYEPDGTEAWTFTDGVAMPSWSHHGQPDDEGTSETKTETEAEAPTPGPAAGLAALAVSIAALARARQRT